MWQEALQIQKDHMTRHKYKDSHMKRLAVGKRPSRTLKEFSFFLALFVRGTLPIWSQSRGRSPIRNLGTRVVTVVPQPSANLSHQQTPWPHVGSKLWRVGLCLLHKVSTTKTTTKSTTKTTTQTAASDTTTATTTTPETNNTVPSAPTTTGL